MFRTLSRRIGSGIATSIDFFISLWIDRLSCRFRSSFIIADPRSIVVVNRAKPRLKRIHARYKVSNPLFRLRGA